MKISKSQFIGVYAYIGVIFFVGFLFFSRPLAGYAADNSNVGFSVSPVYNEFQSKDSSFFDLLVTPNSKQIIGVTVSNTSKEKSSFTIQLVQATTNKNGVIDYTNNNKLDTNVFLPLRDIATYDKQVEVDPGEVKQVPITLSIPNVAFKGEILGGVNVIKNVPKEKDKPQLVNQYSYVIGLRLREGDENPKRNLLAGDAKPEVNFGKPGVTVPLTNDQAVSMGHLEVDSKLMRDGKMIKEDTYKDREMAPNSVYLYSLNWNYKDYVPGDYALTIEVKDAQNHFWKFEKSFKLSAKDVNKVKDAAVHPTKQKLTWFWLVIGLFLIIIVGLLVYIVKNKRKEEH